MWLGAHTSTLFRANSSHEVQPRKRVRSGLKPAVPLVSPWTDMQPSCVILSFRKERKALLPVHLALLIQSLCLPLLIP